MAYCEVLVGDVQVFWVLLPRALDAQAHPKPYGSYNLQSYNAKSLTVFVAWYISEQYNYTTVEHKAACYKTI